MERMSNEEMLYNIMVSMGVIQSDISQLKADVAELKTGMIALENRVMNRGAILELRLDALQELNRRDNALLRKVYIEVATWR